MSNPNVIRVLLQAQLYDRPPLPIGGNVSTGAIQKPRVKSVKEPPGDCIHAYCP